jgi:hypothetical protein
MDLLSSHRNYEWLRNLITGDEKWVLYINYTRKHQWLSVGQTCTVTRDLWGTPKPDYDSDSDGFGVGVGVSKSQFSGVAVGVSY